MQFLNSFLTGMLGNSQSSAAGPRKRFEVLEPRLLFSGDGLAGEYFEDTALTTSAGIYVDATVNFPNDALGDDANGRVVADDVYSIRWTGWVQVQQQGEWQFTTFSNDGVRLWVDGTQLIDNWTQHASQEDNGSITLDAGWHPIVLEYFQENGTTDMRLLYSGPGFAEVIIPQARLSSTDPVGLPIVDAGANQAVILPANSATLDATATDNGTITNYAWTQVGGPNTATIGSAASEDTAVSGLVQGVYTFQLEVTDNEFNTAADTVSVTVAPQTSGNAVVTGELREWHKITLTWDGPTTSETAATNPFTDYRLNVTFTGPSGQTYVVPGYFAADGDAAETSGDAGNKWRAHFAPDEAGTWFYAVDFRTGNNVAISDNPSAGTSAGFFDGDTGTLDVLATDKSGRDLRGKGRLEYVGEHYLQFAGTGEYFIKQGPDAPENLLAYEDFDNTTDVGGRRKSYGAHAGDWNAGDPSWQGGKGTELIGAVNYLASEGVNAFSFLPMNIDGDDKNVFPYISKDASDRTRIDVSKLDQWEIVFEHATHQGMYLHFKTQETENDQLLDGGELGTERKIYYRELIARFSHNLALNWNLGEENTNTEQQRKDFAQYFHDHDPYQHNIVLHTYPGSKNSVYTPLLGSASELTGVSLQTNQADFTNVFNDTLTWVNNSAAAGKKWVVAVDEPGDAQHAIRPDNDAGNSHVDGRKNALWGTLMAGGAGNEWYFGYAHAHSDLSLEDFRSRDAWWDYTRYAHEFFTQNDIPFWEMSNDNAISSASNDYGFTKPGETYVVYLKNGGTTNLDLTGVTGTYDVKWFDPRNGGALQDGSVTQVTGGTSASLGLAPDSTNQDWAILVTRADPKILFIRGGDRTGGFLEAGNDADRTEQLADITNFSTSGGNHGWGELAAELEAQGYFLEQITEGSETASGPADGIHIDLELRDLDRYDAIVFGSNNAVYDQAAIDAFDEYIQNGGAALFISDANFGGDWADAPNSDQQFLDLIGVNVHQDQGTYVVGNTAGEIIAPSHPIFAGGVGAADDVIEFDGEGVSPFHVAQSVAGVNVTLLAGAEGNTRLNQPPFGGNNQGPSRPTDSGDASVFAATYGQGRIVGHYDRNTFFNLNGAGTNINRFDNTQYAINLFDWLTQPSGTPDLFVNFGGAQAVTSYDFGTINSGERLTRRFFINNTGDSDLIVNEALGLPSDSPFSITPANRFLTTDDWTIAPGQTFEFILFYEPTDPGVHADQLLLFSNDPDESRYTIDITGEALFVPGPDLVVNFGGVTEVDSHDFGTVNAGERVSRRFFIDNTGDSDLIVNEALGLPSDSPFSVTPANRFATTDDWTVAPGETFEFIVFYEPDDAGVHTDELLLFSNDPDEPRYEIALSGEALYVPGPDLVVTFGGVQEIVSYDFGDTTVNEQKTRKFTVENDGDSDLIVTEALGLAAGSPFTITPTNRTSSADNWTIAPGGIFEFVVRFKPTAAGLHEDQLQLFSNDPTQGRYDIDLVGNGTPSIAIVAAQTQPIEIARKSKAGVSAVHEYNAWRLAQFLKSQGLGLSQDASLNMDDQDSMGIFDQLINVFPAE